MGKSKLKIFLDEYCEDMKLDKISESSIGRIIKSLKNRGKIPAYTRLSYYARKDHFKEYHHHTKQKLRRKGYYPKHPGDLVQIDCVIKVRNGVRRYIVSAIDNGSEFSKYFDNKLTELSIIHFWNYARKPIYNGKIERYNRINQEECIDPNIDTLFKDLNAFNMLLADWCIFYVMDAYRHLYSDGKSVKLFIRSNPFF